MRFERLTGLLILAATIGVGDVMAQAPKAPVTPTPPRQAGLTNPTAKASEPGKEHKILAGFVGPWKSTVHWLPTAEPTLQQDTHGSAEGKAMLGGRFAQFSETGTLNGAPSEGMILFGFDPVINRYTAIKFDTTSPAFISYAGTYDGSKKQINLEAHFSEQTTHRFTISKMTVTFIDADTIVLDESIAHAMGATFAHTKTVTYKRG